MSLFGRLPGGDPVTRLSLSGGGLEAELLSYGATLRSLRFAGREMVLRGDQLADYLGPLAYAGAIVGRFAGRIGGARFDLDGQSHRLDRNFQGAHCLHGGFHGASHRNWTVLDHAPDRARLGLVLAGEGGFPGRLEIEALFALLGNGVLEITLSAQTDAPTPCNLTHHGYFTLGAPLADLRLDLPAQSVLARDAAQIPTGARLPLEGHPLDFRRPRAIGAQKIDDYFPLDGALRLSSPQNGIALRMDSNQPGVQIYTADHLSRPGIALEAQGYPDAPNQPGFPAAILRPGASYRNLTRYQFETTP